MTRNIVITIILVAIAVGITLYFISDLERKSRKPEEPPRAKSEQKPTVAKIKRPEISREKEPIVTNKNEEEIAVDDDNKEEPTSDPVTDNAELIKKAQEIKEKTNLLLSKAVFSSADIPEAKDLLSISEHQMVIEMAEKTLITPIIEKIATDSAQNDALMDIGKFKESKLKEGETLAELPNAGEDKVLDDGTTVIRKGFNSISIKTTSGEEEYKADNVLFIRDKDNKYSFRIIEDPPKLPYSDRLKLYAETLEAILSKGKARKLLEDKMYGETDTNRRLRFSDASRFLY